MLEDPSAQPVVRRHEGARNMTNQASERATTPLSSSRTWAQQEPVHDPKTDRRFAHLPPYLFDHTVERIDRIAEINKEPAE
jgi:hypothetical protein